MTNRKITISVIAVLLSLALVLPTVVTMLPPGASAASSSTLKEQLKDLQAQKNEISAQLKELESQQSENLADMESVINQKNVIDQQVALLHAEIANVNEQITAYSLLIADKQVELEEAQKRLQELNEKHKERIRAMEEEGELSYWSVLFKANSFSDFLDRLNMVNEIANADRRRLKELADAATEVEEAQKELSENKAELEKNRAEMENSQQVLDQKSQEADRLLQDLMLIAGDLEDLHNRFEKEEEDFLDQIAQKEQEYNQQLQAEKEASKKASQQASKEASKQASIASSKHQATAPTGGSSSNIGNKNPSGVVWLVPCSYQRVSSPFGYRWHPTTGEWSMHKGVDLAAPKGTKIYASRSGVVSWATYHTTAGNYVGINHQDGYSSVYMHMTHYVVKAGQYVTAGQLIGYVGSTGRSTGPHLHFGISYNGSYVNPMDYIG